MDTDNNLAPLSEISTLWSVVSQAHDGEAAEVSDAVRQLLGRYGRAVHRYLLGAVRDAEAADDLAQEFALRLIRGKLKGADPERGRFRDFVKGVLSHLVADYYRRRRPAQMGVNTPEPATPPEDVGEQDRQFVEGWRDELMGRAWETLQRIERQTGQLYHTVLWWRAQHPELKSAELAEKLSARLGKPVTADWTRQTLHRAREKYADLLIREVVQTLKTPTAESLEQELGELGLLEHCRPFLARYADKK